MILTTVKIADLKPHSLNYNKHSEEQLAELEKSLDQFNQFKNVVVNGESVILAGHGLVEAARRKGLTEIDAVVRDDLTEEQQTALLIADNATPFLAQPDTDMLQELLESVGDIEIPGVNDEWLNNLNLLSDGMTFDEPEDDNIYSSEITAPVYEPNNEKPLLVDLYDIEKTTQLIDEIESSDIPTKEKEFLIQAARRHTVFNYQKIADYYANSTKPIQDLMEKSALVIIDFDKAIENGYVLVSQYITDQFHHEYDN